ncbi:MAG TPA: hypothetical protein VHM02_15015 [Thermoanaerobaculia bacterium]|nr:hypothetical protein [Thermoanaerobaculia bacterium]
MIAGSYDPGIFEHVAHKTPREHVPYFRSGTGMADSSFGSGQLWIQPEAHMHLDWGRRLSRHPDGGGVVLFNAIHELRNEEPRWPVKRDVYVVIHVARKTEPELLDWNFEKFVLSF